MPQDISQGIVHSIGGKRVLYAHDKHGVTISVGTKKHRTTARISWENFGSLSQVLVPSERETAEGKIETVLESTPVVKLINGNGKTVAEFNCNSPANAAKLSADIFMVLGNIANVKGIDSIFDADPNKVVRNRGNKPKAPVAPRAAKKAPASSSSSSSLSSGGGKKKAKGGKAAAAKPKPKPKADPSDSDSDSDGEIASDDE